MKPLALCLALALSGSTVFPSDWPQWCGPSRDGVSRETGLHLDWRERKPRLVWAFKQADAGYSTPTIVVGTLYCQGAADDSDFGFALDVETGRLKWKQTLGPMFIQDRGDGPRGAVTVDGDSLYLIRGGALVNGSIQASEGRVCHGFCLAGRK